MNRPSSLAAVAAFTSLSLCVVPAHADDEKTLDACIEQFVATTFAGFQGKVSVHKEISHASLSPAASNHFVITVSATDPAHGTELASVVCHVNQAGKVVSLQPMHATSKMTFATHVDTDKSAVAANADAKNLENRND